MLEAYEQENSLTTEFLSCYQNGQFGTLNSQISTESDSIFRLGSAIKGALK